MNEDFDRDPLNVPAPPGDDDWPPGQATGGHADEDPPVDAFFFGTAPCLTPEITEACQRVAHWARLDQAGCTINGLQRNGKTQCARFMHDSMQQILGAGTMPVLWRNVAASKSKDLEWARDRLKQSGCMAINHRWAPTLIRRLTDHLRASARTRNAKRILLILDEAQLTSESQFEMLADIYNGLSDDFIVFCVLIGQPELKSLEKTFSTNDAMNLILRFFQLKHEFRGCSLEDLAEVLQSLDDLGTPSVVHENLPELASRGWKLADAAKAFEQAVKVLRKSTGINHEVRLQMQALRGAVNGLLYRMRDSADPLSMVDPKVIAEAFIEIEYPSIMHLYR